MKAAGLPALTLLAVVVTAAACPGALVRRCAVKGDCTGLYQACNRRTGMCEPDPITYASSRKVADHQANNARLFWWEEGDAAAPRRGSCRMSSTRTATT